MKPPPCSPRGGRGSNSIGNWITPPPGHPAGGFFTSRGLDFRRGVEDGYPMKTAMILASTYGMLSVILGAFGAHALKARLTTDQLMSWETGVRYQMYHALALLLLALLEDKGWNLKPSVICFGVGVALFSGSIYLLSLGIGPRALLGPITPIGGLLLIVGWAWLLKTALRSDLF